MTRATGLVTTTDLPAVASHPFYQRLNKLLREHGFDDFVEAGCPTLRLETYNPTLAAESDSRGGISSIRSCPTSGTRMGNGAQCPQVNFGVDGSVPFALMAQCLGDLGPGGSIAEDLGSERMAKQVRPSGGRVNSGTSGAEARGPTDVAASLLMCSSAETSRQASRRRPALFFLQSGPWVGRH